MTTLPYLFFLFGEANEQLEKNIIHIHSYGMCFFVHHWWAVAKPARQHQKTWHQWLNELNHSWFRLSNWGHVQICFPSSNQETINQQCVVPENIQTPATEGISLRTPPPLWIFHFCKELMTPHPFGISTSVTKTPQPLWKSSFSQRKTIKVKEWGILWLVPNDFHQKLVCFCFHLFEWSRNIKTHYTTTK